MVLCAKSMHVLLATSALVVAGCAAPNPGKVLPVEKEKLRYVCDWGPRAPRVNPVVVDLGVRIEESNRAPTPADLGAVEAAGGRVLHAFHVGVVRIVVDTGALRAMVSSPIAQYAFTVTDASDMRVAVLIFYSDRVSAADIEAVRQRGGEEIRERNVERSILGAILPDTAIPAVRKLPKVRVVGAYAADCAGGLGRD